MARSARRGSRRSFRRAGRVDWVYRNHIFANEMIMSHGGWGGAYEINGPGANSSNAATIILLDSINILKAYSQFDTFGIATGDEGLLTAAARPDMKRLPIAHCVQGYLLQRVSAWSTGSRLAWGIRLGWYEQDLESGQLALEADYCMFDNNTSLFEQGPAVYANDTATHIKDWVIWNESETGSPSRSTFPIHLFWKGRRQAPSEKHCLALYMEGIELGGYQRPLLRTQVRALIG